jgi:glycosyltransferase involved in cell wall biosynthesis
VSRILVITHDPVQKRMAGPAVRAFALATELQEAGHKVVLAIPNDSDLGPQPFRMQRYDRDLLRGLARNQDVILFHGWTLESFPFLLETGARLIVDLYGPFLLELLVTRENDPHPENLADPEATLMVTNDQLRRGDFFICASEKQRDYWLGMLTAMNRVNAHTMAADPTLRSLIDVVPFGLPDHPPEKKEAAIRGVIPGIDASDYVLLWGSAIYNWFDPLTLIEAVSVAARKIPSLKLVVLGTSHPNPDVAPQSVERLAIERSASLGLTGSHVFFNRGWVPYERRVDWLLDADVGVSTNRQNLESHYAFRTRFLDYFWAGLPVLCTSGDTLADSVASEGLGITVPPGDCEKLVDAIERLSDPDFRRRCSENIARFRERFTWRKAAGPLVRYCAEPRRAPDLAHLPPGFAREVPVHHEDPIRGRLDWRRLTLRAVETAIYDGPARLLGKSSRYLLRRKRD